jgi:hypothetical protein
MRPRPRWPPLPTGYRVLLCLCVALCAAFPSRTPAQPAAAPDGKAPYPYVAGVKAYACVDPSDATARRRLQDEPCTLPMYQLPRSEVATVDGPPRQRLARSSSGTDAGHAMFWRFPLQPLGPHQVPRHGGR